MNIRARAASKTFKEVSNQFGLQVADSCGSYLRFNHRHRAATKIYRRQAERFVHRHQKISRSQNAAPIRERAIKRLTQSDSNIFDRMVLIDVKIANRCQLQVKASMSGEKFQHMIEKTNAGRNFIFSS